MTTMKRVILSPRLYSRLLKFSIPRKNKTTCSLKRLPNKNLTSMKTFKALMMLSISREKTTLKSIFKITLKKNKSIICLKNQASQILLKIIITTMKSKRSQMGSSLRSLTLNLRSKRKSIRSMSCKKTPSL